MDTNNTFKLIQCYHCLVLADHVKNNCPHKDEPQVCGRCGESGHSSRDCSAAPQCHLCGKAGHPATARICPIYKNTFKLKMEELLAPSFPQTAGTTSTPYPSSPINSMSSDSEKILESLQRAAMASVTTQDFCDTMFTLLKVTIPQGSSVVPSMAYGCDLELSDDSESEDAFKDTIAPVIPPPVAPTEVTQEPALPMKVTPTTVPDNDIHMVLTNKGIIQPLTPEPTETLPVVGLNGHLEKAVHLGISYLNGVWFMTMMAKDGPQEWTSALRIMDMKLVTQTDHQIQINFKEHVEGAKIINVSNVKRISRIIPISKYI